MDHIEQFISDVDSGKISSLVPSQASDNPTSPKKPLSITDIRALITEYRKQLLLAAVILLFSAAVGIIAALFHDSYTDTQTPPLPSTNPEESQAGKSAKERPSSPHKKDE